LIAAENAENAEVLRLTISRRYIQKCFDFDGVAFVDVEALRAFRVFRG
jgi:hypothetical protein